MIRLALLLLANLSLGAADKPAGHSFLMLGGLTQIIDASGKVTWKYPAINRDKKVVGPTPTPRTKAYTSSSCWTRLANH